MGKNNGRVEVREYMKKEVTSKKTRVYHWAIIFVGIIMVMPLIRLALFAHPSADDYTYAISTYHVYKETHSIIAVIREAVATSIKYYSFWQGLYTSAFIQALQPAIFGENMYFLTTVYVLGAMWISTFIFLYYVLCVVLHCDKTRTFALATMICTVMSQYMPSAVQGYYWYNGGMAYAFYYGVIVLAVTFAIAGCNCKVMWKSILCLVLALTLAFLVSGGNYVSALEGTMIWALFVLIGIIIKSKRVVVTGCIVFVGSFVGLLVNVLSPGTRARQGLYEGMTPINAIINSLKEGTLLLGKYWGFTTVFFIVVTIPIMIALLEAIIKNTGFEFKYPLFAFIISYLFICALLCPPLYAMGGIGEGRLHNVVFQAAILLLFFNVFYSLGYWMNKLGYLDKTTAYDFFREKIYISKLHSILGVVAVVFVAALLLSDSWGYKAAESILSGEAKEYEAEMYYRSKLLREGDKEVVLPVIRTKPEMLFFSEIADSPEVWPNTDIGKYYDLEKVYLETGVGGGSE